MRIQYRFEVYKVDPTEQNHARLVQMALKLFF